MFLLNAKAGRKQGIWDEFTIQNVSIKLEEFHDYLVDRYDLQYKMFLLNLDISVKKFTHLGIYNTKCFY